MASTSTDVAGAAVPAILAAVDARAADGVALLARLVRQRSVLGEEHGALDEVAAAFEGLGLAPFRVPVDADSLGSCPGSRRR